VLDVKSQEACFFADRLRRWIADAGSNFAIPAESRLSKTAA